VGNSLQRTVQGKGATFCFGLRRLDGDRVRRNRRAYRRWVVGVVSVLGGTVADLYGSVLAKFTG
jgi:hypothetical protein